MHRQVTFMCFEKSNHDIFVILYEWFLTNVFVLSGLHAVTKFSFTHKVVNASVDEGDGGVAQHTQIKTLWEIF